MGAQPQVVRTARDVQVVNDLFAAQERVVGQEDVPVEKAEAVDVQLRPERVVRTCKGIVVVVLEARLVDHPGREGVRPSQESGAVQRVGDEAARKAHQGLEVLVGLEARGDVVAQRELVGIVQPVIDSKQALVVVGLEGEDAAVVLKQ